MTAIHLQHRRFQGLAQIVRFNWTFYLIALSASVAATVIVKHVHLPPIVRDGMLVGVGVAMYLVIASLVATFWIYDCSRLRRWDWIAEVVNHTPQRWINLHCGLDESTPALRQIFPHAPGRVFDMFDAAEMTEPSIHRARTLAKLPEPAETVRFDQLPIEDASCDAAFLLLSAHELRHHEARVALFRELLRGLRPGGQIVLAEHLRDVANFLAFGPGFLHFHTRAAWHRAAADAGFAIDREFRITPFINVLILGRPQ